MTEGSTAQESGQGPGSRKPSMRVVDRVAAAEGVDPSELRPQLYEVVDPSSLDRLFAPSDRAAASVTFAYAGHEVTVGSDGSVRLD